jgi:RNA polymerase sigma-70 factor (ECF subfamily)
LRFTGVAGMVDAAMLGRDPLAHPEALIPRVYAYVAYRIGDGPDAEDVTSDTFERALRYRASYDPARGDVLGWLIGIARRRIADRGTPGESGLETQSEAAAPDDVEDDAVRRLTISAAVAGLDDGDRELIALRYGADLTARQIGRVLDRRTNAVEVALHRALGRLRERLEAGHGAELRSDVRAGL